MEKRRQFMQRIAHVHASDHPLPPELTGVPWPPGYDPAQSPWKSLDVKGLGVVRVAGKDVDLYKLWILVANAGGKLKVDEKNQWQAVARMFTLPDHLPVPLANGITTTGALIAQLYQLLIAKFEEIYQLHVERARADQALSGPSQMGAVPGMAPGMAFGGMAPSLSSSSSQSLSSLSGAGPAGLRQMSPTNNFHAPQIAQHSPGGMGGSLGMSNALLGGPGLSQQLSRPQSSIGGHQYNPLTQLTNGMDGEHDMEGRKRRQGDLEEPEAKRMRQKSDVSDIRASIGLSGLNGHALQAATGARAVRQPSRRKIEYIPCARDCDTAGGRDLSQIQQEHVNATRRLVKLMEEWGQVDIQAVALSLRSRLDIELSYALTTCIMLTLARFDGRDFPIAMATDIFDELLDILEDFGFDGKDDDGEVDLESAPRIWTNRELVNALLEDGSKTFAALEPKQGWKDLARGPRPRSAEHILMTMNIMRNLSTHLENCEFMARHPRYLSILLRLCMLAPHEGDGVPAPASSALSLQDLLTVRREFLNTVVNLTPFIDFNSPAIPAKQQMLNARRAYEILSSYLVDPTEAVSPVAVILLTGVAPLAAQPKPSSVADIALEIFTRLFHPDDNRRLLSQSVPQEWLWTLIEALLHRLPLTDGDFSVIMRETWLGYVEKLLMGIYAIAFLAPPALKRRIKTDRRLACPKVLLRVIKKFSIHSPPNTREFFSISVRRAIEALKLIDDAEDSFDTTQAAAPTLMFGMGYGEHGETRVERGMGLLSGYQEEMTWNLMTNREILGDQSVFSELESLVRVDQAASVTPV
ncbi:hypothetical protein WOLCODRAFT_129824 [Wolfiporia cocos MD-104 SS10]|uniref:ARID domain-containing protein n=1 Tax=Wolfiporia cocos (strain MD-104) TaxID=742152 RepID=A0A2H3J179_WOLCO|nr:hypothetical protein WOLCODRAFT_129824 [Wolfiporia cocos MD-104 SS10]